MYFPEFRAVDLVALELVDMPVVPPCNSVPIRIRVGLCDADPTRICA